MQCSCIKAEGLSVKEYEGIYKPDDHMTRIEMVYMIDRALGFEEVAKADRSHTTFTDDASISPMHKGYLNVAHALGIVNGFGDGSVQPYALASRAEAFVMFYRIRREKRDEASEPRPSFDFAVPLTPGSLRFPMGWGSPVSFIY